MASGNEEIDVSVGALVWVRRPNGSWWPGRVVGPEDLSPCQSKRPKTGTPIRLLGRENGTLGEEPSKTGRDLCNGQKYWIYSQEEWLFQQPSSLRLSEIWNALAAVINFDWKRDWYNLEKSKRVKSFRCGEYDELIVKAKVDSVLRANRKSTGEGKNVRREDAILHALELEKARNFFENQKLTDINFALQSNQYCKKPVHMARTPNSFKESRHELSQSVVSFENTCTASGVHFMQRKRMRTPNDSEDDATEGMKRMRDLQDLGFAVVAKTEPKVHLQMRESCGLATPDNVLRSGSDFENDFCGVSPMNSSKDSISSLKRKRSRLIQAYEDSEKKSRHRSLWKVWAGSGSAKIGSNSVFHGDDLGGQSFLRGVKHTEIRDHKSTLGKPDFPSAFDSPNSSGTSCEEYLFDTNENNYNATINCPHNPSLVKDCQNSSILELVANNFSGGFTEVPVVGVKNATDMFPTFGPCPASKLNSCSEEDQPDGFVQLNEGLGDTPVSQKIDMGSSEWYSKGKRNLRYLNLTKNIDRDNQSVSCLVNGTEKENMDSTSDESPTKCMLLSEVGDLTGDRTPKVSSSIDGTHDFADENGALPPRHIRLPSRYRTSEQQSSICSPLHNVELNVQTSYRAKRVPLVSLMSKLNGRAIVGHPITVEVLATCGDHTIKKLLKDNSPAKGKQSELKGKISSARMVRCPLLAWKSNHGKKSGFSPRKVRKLSSFSADRKKEDKRRSVVEKIEGTTVSCIPLRLVFSRLNEALSNSTRPAK